MRESYGMSAEELLAEGLVDGDDFDDYGDVLFDSSDIDLSDTTLLESYYRHFDVPKPIPATRASVEDGDDDDEIKF